MPCENISYDCYCLLACDAVQPDQFYRRFSATCCFLLLTFWRWRENVSNICKLKPNYTVSHPTRQKNLNPRSGIRRFSILNQNRLKSLNRQIDWKDQLWRRNVTFLSLTMENLCVCCICTFLFLSVQCSHVSALKNAVLWRIWSLLGNVSLSMLPLQRIAADKFIVGQRFCKQVPTAKDKHRKHKNKWTVRHGDLYSDRTEIIKDLVQWDIAQSEDSEPWNVVRHLSFVRDFSVQLLSINQRTTEAEEVTYSSIRTKPVTVEEKALVVQ
jgi:hypothetical protein